MNLEFYRGKRVFVTGHTGFKGSWICRMLVGAGAVVTGYSLEPPTTPNLFSLAGLEGKMTSVIGDIRDFASLKAAFDAARPEIVLQNTRRGHCNHTPLTGSLCGLVIPSPCHFTPKSNPAPQRIAASVPGYRW